MDTVELVRNPDELDKGIHTMETLESHGCYNQNIMKHVRPEHDYRIDTFDQCVEKTEENRQICCSVIPWMSR